MNRMARLACLAVSLLSLAAPVAAQSMYGLIFLGEERFAGNVRQRALALSSFAVSDTLRAIGGNTAALADLSQVTFSLSEFLGVSRIQSGDETSSLNRLQVPEVMLAVPLRKGLVGALGYRTRFAGKGDFSFARPLEGSSTPYDVYSRRSSLFTVPISLAWRPFDALALGGELHIERGSIKDVVSVLFYGENYITAQSKRTQRYSGTSWSASFLLEALPRLWVGALWDAAVEYDVEETFEYTRSDLDSSASWECELPPSFGVGVAAGIAERWWLSGYYWSREAPKAPFPGGDGASIGAGRLIAAGIERRARATGSFLDRHPLRFGYSEQRWHAEYPAGEPITGRFVTAGTSFAMPGGPGSIDLAIELGQIGSTDSNGLSDRMVRLGLGISASEAWSRRKEER